MHILPNPMEGESSLSLTPEQSANRRDISHIMRIVNIIIERMQSGSWTLTFEHGRLDAIDVTRRQFTRSKE